MTHNPHHGARRNRPHLAAVAALTAGLGLSGLATAPVATSAPVAAPASPVACPLAYPADELHGLTGQAVTGRTVTSGTEPSGFTGEIIGVYRDGIAPGLDMVLARLSSEEIDRVGGIWQGMSGSPVYAADGRLIGAVAYGLAAGPSTVAGITPAAEMYQMLSTRPGEATGTTAPPATVELPTALRRRLADDGVATRAATATGLTRLAPSLTVSGLRGARRLALAERSFGIAGARVRSGGSVSASAAPVPVVAGGNLAASISYGDVSMIGVGTATAVCGDEVIGFGHPMAFTGPSTLTMHGADALLIQEDSLGAPFKVANVGGPVGGVSQDRLSGLAGVQRAAAVPTTTGITSYVEVVGGRARTGTTQISLPDAVPEVATMHLLADQDRVLDGIGRGSAQVSWRIRGRRADGRPFRLLRSDRFASQDDIASEPSWDLFDQLTQLHFNEAENVRITDITTTSTISRRYAAYRIGRVEARQFGRWTVLREDRPVVLRAGGTQRIRVTLHSPELGVRTVRLALPVPERLGRRAGVLEISGGNNPSFEGGEEFFGLGELFDVAGEDAPSTFDGVLRQLRRLPRNNQVLAELTLVGPSGAVTKRSARVDTRAVVDGAMTAEVMGLG